MPALERAGAGAHELADTYARVVRNGTPAGPRPPFTELALLSTCNRVELYAVARAKIHEARSELIRPFLAAGLEPAGRTPSPGTFYTLEGADAATHLCRVAAGLDSMVLGEPQIAGQVARAVRAAWHENGGAPTLAALAQAAQRAGRRARAETGVARGPAGVSAVAVRVAVEAMGGLAGRNIVVLGAGKIGRLACRALRAAAGEDGRITVVNRTRSRAEALASGVGGRVADLAALEALLAEADVVLASTTSPVPLIDVDLATRVSARRRGRPLLVLDLAVPRDVAPGVGAIDGMRLLDLDDLRSRLDHLLADRRTHVPAVEAIVAEEIHAWQRMGDAEVTGAIDALYRTAERARRGEVARFLAELGEPDEETRARVEHITRSIVRRLLHEPAARIRGEPEPERRRAYAQLALTLFGLDQPAATDGPPSP